MNETPSIPGEWGKKYFSEVAASPIRVQLAEKCKTKLNGIFGSAAQPIPSPLGIGDNLASLAGYRARGLKEAGGISSDRIDVDLMSIFQRMNMVDFRGHEQELVDIVTAALDMSSQIKRENGGDRFGSVTINSLQSGSPDIGVADTLAAVKGVDDFCRDQLYQLITRTKMTGNLEAARDRLMEELRLRNIIVERSTNLGSFGMADQFPWSALDKADAEQSEEKTRGKLEESQTPVEDTPAEKLMQIERKLEDMGVKLDQLVTDRQALLALVREQREKVAEVEAQQELRKIATEAEAMVDLKDVISIVDGFTNGRTLELLAANIDKILDLWRIENDDRTKITDAVTGMQMVIGLLGESVLPRAKEEVLKLISEATHGLNDKILEAIVAGVAGNIPEVVSLEVDPATALSAAREKLAALTKAFADLAQV